LAWLRGFSEKDYKALGDVGHGFTGSQCEVNDLKGVSSVAIAYKMRRLPFFNVLPQRLF
jgi:hypothetical protein